MKLQGVRSLVIGDLYIPCAVMRQAVSRLSPGHLEALEWKVADLAELQARLLLLEQHGPDAAEPPDGVWEYLPETEFLMTHLCPVNRKMIEAAPNLRYLGVCRGGMDTIDHKAIQKRRIRVFNAPGRNANAVAEMTVALMLVEARNIARAHASLAAGRWRKEFGNDGIPGELRGKVIGLIGFGAIGRRVAEVLKGFGAELIIHDPQVSTELIRTAGAQKVGLPELLRQADFVTLHVRRDPDEVPLIGRAELAQMKPTAYLINTARACFVDEAALCEALQKKQIAGAALDVFDEEPLPADSPLRRLDNITLTPHLAGSTPEAWECAPGIVVQSMLKQLA